MRLLALFCRSFVFPQSKNYTFICGLKRENDLIVIQCAM